MYSSRPLIVRRSLQTTILFVVAVGHITSALGDDQKPLPLINDMEVAATVHYSSVTSNYTYIYRTTSLPSNTGNVRDIRIDITTALGQNFNIEHPITQYKDLVVARLQEQGINVLPVQLSAPEGWRVNNLTVAGRAVWGGNAVNTIKPGQTLDGFTLVSKFVPGIRDIAISPAISRWNLYPDADDPEAVIKEKEALIRSLDFTGYTLGPVGVTPGSFAHWNQVRADLNKAIELGWVPDATLASNLLSQLAAARKALNAGDGTAAKAKLHTLIETVMGASDAQRRPEVRDLLGLNARALIDHLTPQTNQARPG